MPHLRAGKEKYDNYGPEILTFADDDCIYTRKVGAAQSFNVVTGQVDTKVTIPRLPQSNTIPENMSVIEVEEIPDPPLSARTTLASGDLRCWFEFRRWRLSWPHCMYRLFKYQLKIGDHVVETFVSQGKPQIVQVRNKYYALVVNADDGHDVYRLDI